MARALIDTLGLARRLRERAGVAPEHAEEMAQAFAETLTDRVATVDDLERATEELRGEIHSLRAEIKAEIKAEVNAARVDLTRMMLTVATGQVALLLGVMLSLARFAR